MQTQKQVRNGNINKRININSNNNNNNNNNNLETLGDNNTTKTLLGGEKFVNIRSFFMEYLSIWKAALTELATEQQLFICNRALQLHTYKIMPNKVSFLYTSNKERLLISRE